MFTVGDRERVSERVFKMAAEDARVVASAVVGSLAVSEGDRWSDLDLTFAVADNAQLEDVLADWTRTLVRELDAAHLFDLLAGASVYRVFLLPGCLQFDLSFTPASQFGASGPKFKLLSGAAAEKPHIQPTPEQELFGYAVHHAVRARICMNEAATGRLSIGSAAFVITRSAWRVVAAASRHSTVAASTISLPTSGIVSSRRYRLLFSAMLSWRRFASPSMGCCMKLVTCRNPSRRSSRGYVR
jgi:hypothetical protein